MTRYGTTIYNTPDVAEEVMSQARKMRVGSYQMDLLCGGEMWSGSSLQGKARQYGASYSTSRQSLRHKINAWGYAVRSELRKINGHVYRITIIYGDCGYDSGGAD